MHGTRRAPERAEDHTELGEEALPSWGLRAKALTGRNASPGHLLFPDFWDGSWNAFSGNHPGEDKPARFLSGLVAVSSQEFAFETRACPHEHRQFVFPGCRCAVEDHRETGRWRVVATCLGRHSLFSGAGRCGQPCSPLTRSATIMPWSDPSASGCRCSIASTCRSSLTSRWS